MQIDDNETNRAESWMVSACVALTLCIIVHLYCFSYIYLIDNNAEPAKAISQLRGCSSWTVTHDRLIDAYFLYVWYVISVVIVQKEKNNMFLTGGSQYRWFNNFFFHQFILFSLFHIVVYYDFLTFAFCLLGMYHFM